ncbi:MAG: HlyD family secretion protein, partial [Sphingomonas bacterium]|nr:HlyD family secretion protein [Sphingomonas bacterium]
MNKVTRIESETAVGSDEVVRETVVEAKPRKSRKRMVVMFGVPALIAAIGLFFWLTGGTSVSTDNAYVKQDIVAISTQVNGPVAAVFVREN